MRGATEARDREVADAAEGVARAVEAARLVGRGWCMQRIALLGHEDEDDAVDDAEDLLEQLLLVERAALDRIGEHVAQAKANIIARKANRSRT